MRFFVLAAGIIALSACTVVPTRVTGPRSPNVTTPVSDKDGSYSGGLRTLFAPIPEQLRLKEGIPISVIEPGDSLRGQIALIDEFPVSKQVLVSLLLNYLQSDFAVDSNEFRPEHRLTLNPSEVTRFQVRTHELPEGYYDIAWVFVLDPDNMETDTRSRARTTFTPVYRHSAYVGNASPPQITQDSIDHIVPDSSSRYGDLLSLTSSPDSFSLWSDTDVKPGASLEPFIRLGVPSYQLVNGATDIPIALVGFFDYHQIKMNGQDVIYGIARQGFVTTIPIAFDTPRFPGPHQFFVHRFPHPYLPIPQSTVPLSSLSTQRLVIHIAE